MIWVVWLIPWFWMAHASPQANLLSSANVSGPTPGQVAFFELMRPMPRVTVESPANPPSARSVSIDSNFTSMDAVRSARLTIVRFDLATPSPAVDASLAAAHPIGAVWINQAFMSLQNGGSSSGDGNVESGGAGSGAGAADADELGSMALATLNATQAQLIDLRNSIAGTGNAVPVTSTSTGGGITTGTGSNPGGSGPVLIGVNGNGGGRGTGTGVVVPEPTMGLPLLILTPFLRRRARRR